MSEKITREMYTSVRNEGIKDAFEILKYAVKIHGPVKDLQELTETLQFFTKERDNYIVEGLAQILIAFINSPEIAKDWINDFIISYMNYRLKDNTKETIQ